MDRRRVMLVVAVLVAALGAGLVFVYAQGAEDRAAQEYDTVDVLVATQQIAAGESASAASAAGKLVSRPVPRGQLLEGATNDGTLFADTVALTTIYPGEQLLPQKFGTVDQVEGESTIAFPEGDIAVQVPMTDYGKVGAFTRPGSHVVIFVQPIADPTVPADPNAPADDAEAALPLAEVLLSDVLVIGVGSATTAAAPTDAQGNPLEETPTTNLTLAVNEREARLLIAAASQADAGESTLWFGLRNDASEVSPSEVFRDGKGNRVPAPGDGA